jgi:hypothetical protein
MVRCGVNGGNSGRLGCGARRSSSGVCGCCGVRRMQHSHTWNSGSRWLLPSVARWSEDFSPGSSRSGGGNARKAAGIVARLKSLRANCSGWSMRPAIFSEELFGTRSPDQKTIYPLYRDMRRHVVVLKNPRARELLEKVATCFYNYSAAQDWGYMARDTAYIAAEAGRPSWELSAAEKLFLTCKRWRRSTQRSRSTSTRYSKSRRKNVDGFVSKGVSGRPDSPTCGAVSPEDPSSSHGSRGHAAGPPVTTRWSAWIGLSTTRPHRR